MINNIINNRMPHMVDRIPITIVNMSVTVSSVVHAEEIKRKYSTKHSMKFTFNVM